MHDDDPEISLYGHRTRRGAADRQPVETSLIVRHNRRSINLLSLDQGEVIGNLRELSDQNLS
jgi:hypothetical protein